MGKPFKPRFGAVAEDPTPEEIAAHIAEMAEANERRKHPPCLECGATSLADADDKCRCGGDKDHCHGCELWPVD